MHTGNALRLPKPVVAPDILEMDFLCDIQPAIDALASSPTRLLGHLMVSMTDKATPVDEISQAILRLYSLSSPTKFTRSDIHNQILCYFGDEQAPAGLVAMSTVSTGTVNPSYTVRPTDIGKESVPLVGVLAAMQLGHTFPIGTALRKRGPKGVPKLVYPYLPSLRLRIAQLMLLRKTVSIQDLADNLARTAGERVNEGLHSTMSNMRKDNLVRRLDAKGTYTLTDTAAKPMAVLLSALASLRDETYCRDVAQSAYQLLDPNDGPPLVHDLRKGWLSPIVDIPDVDKYRNHPFRLDESAILAELILHHYTNNTQHDQVKTRVRKLLDSGIAVLHRGVNELSVPVLQLTAAITTGLPTIEQRLFAKGFAVEDLLFSNLPPLQPHEVKNSIRLAGYTTFDDYLKEYLAPKIRRIIQQTNQP